MDLQHPPSIFCPEPQENNLLYSASIVAQKFWFLNPFLAPRLFLNYCCQKEISGSYIKPISHDKWKIHS